jgi:transcriptional regulator with XRE-family HTH domain
VPRRSSPDDIERGRRLRKARLDAGLLQEDLAELAGVSRTSISTYERGGRVPQPENAAKLANVLADLEPEDLMDVLSPSFLDAFNRLVAEVEEIRTLLVDCAT